ncbi:hypothetical protein JP75_21025 [Devosia riboflavina]|uniref:DUF2147 domain-containing protein n=1 Tax=Devosia riboflavina TaxID=46914 RepID=A0A087LXT7_9HYPH|nr:hypothetical protein [Devosia riboflavina]KFL29440.1 hypothetical protein JP75_21025 [Devosia riboflavina]
MCGLKPLVFTCAVFVGLSLPVLAQDATFDPNGTFADEFGTTFTFALCGAGTDLCGTLDILKGESATEENLAYVGSVVMQAQQTEANTWKGTLQAGDLSAEATVRQTSPDTIDIEGCRGGLLCQTLTYTRQ